MNDIVIVISDTEFNVRWVVFRWMVIVVARSDGAQPWQPVGDGIIVVGYGGGNWSGKYGCRRKKQVKEIE